MRLLRGNSARLNSNLLTSLFGKRRAPEFVDLSCPLCGHTQRESSLVISTNCRSCNTYLKIENGIAIPPVHHDDNPRYQTRTTEAEPEPTPKAAPEPTPAEKPSPAPTPEAKKSISPLPNAPPEVAAEAPKPSDPTPPVPKELPRDEAPTAASPAAASVPSTQPRNPLPKKALKPQAPSPPPKPEPVPIAPITPVEEPVAEAAPQENAKPEAPEKPATETPKPAPQAAPERYRPPESTSTEASKPIISPLINREKKRNVKCFECLQEHEILADSKSALCPHCGAYIGLKDYDIKDQVNSRIQTRGNVFVHKKGYITGITIHAHNLTIEGEIQGGADCTGDFIVRKNGKINGAVTSDRVIIERRAEVEFLSPVEAREVIIDGHVTGSVACKKLVLKKRATLDGDLTVASLSVEEGAKHTGKIQMTGLL